MYVCKYMYIYIYTPRDKQKDPSLQDSFCCIENFQNRVKFPDYRRNIEIVESWYISKCVTADKQYKKMYFGVPYVVAVRETQ